MNAKKLYEPNISFLVIIINLIFLNKGYDDNKEDIIYKANLML